MNETRETPPSDVSSQALLDHVEKTCELHQQSLEVIKLQHQDLHELKELVARQASQIEARDVQIDGLTRSLKAAAETITSMAPGKAKRVNNSTETPSAADISEVTPVSATKLTSAGNKRFEIGTRDGRTFQVSADSVTTTEDWFSFEAEGHDSKVLFSAKHVAFWMELPDWTPKETSLLPEGGTQ